MRRDYNERKALIIADAAAHMYEHMRRCGYDNEGHPILFDGLNNKRIKIIIETVAEHDQVTTEKDVVNDFGDGALEPSIAVKRF